MALGGGSVSSRAPRGLQAERRWFDVSDVYLPIDQPRSFLRMLEQGPESRSAAAICAGGVSAAMTALRRRPRKRAHQKPLRRRYLSYDHWSSAVLA